MLILFACYYCLFYVWFRTFALYMDKQKQNVDNKQIEFLVITVYVFALVIDYWSIKNSMLFEGGLE